MLKTKGIGGVIGYAPMGMELFKKGKLSILPHRIKGKDQIKRIFEEVEK
jgi:heterodisulfide reductase subunit C